MMQQSVNVKAEKRKRKRSKRKRKTNLLSELSQLYVVH